jgi:hypothetical protein
METDSVVYRITVRPAAATNAELHLTEVQRLPTIGAHGFEFFEGNSESFLAVPNYYGGDSVVYKWKRGGGGGFVEWQRIKSDGAGSLESFTLPARDGGGDGSGEPLVVLGIAEFNVGIAALYALDVSNAARVGRRFAFVLVFAGVCWCVLVCVFIVMIQVCGTQDPGRGSSSQQTCCHQHHPPPHASLSHTHTHTHTHARAHTHPITLSHAHIHARTHARTHAIPRPCHQQPHHRPSQESSSHGNGWQLQVWVQWPPS